MVHSWHAFLHDVQLKPLVNRLTGSKNSTDAIPASKDQFEKMPVDQMESSAEEAFQDTVDSVEETISTIRNGPLKGSSEGLHEHIDHSPYQMKHPSEKKPPEPEEHLPESNRTHHSEEAHSPKRHEEGSSGENSVPKEERTVPEQEGHAENNPKGREREEHLPEGLTREELQDMERLEKEKTSFKNSDRAFEVKVNLIQQFIREEKASFERNNRENLRRLAADKAHLSELERSTIPVLFNTLISKLDALKSCSPQLALSEAESLFKNCGVDIAKYRSEYAALNRPCPFDFTAMANQLECFRKELMPLLEKKH